jgi:hypothetical protein
MKAGARGVPFGEIHTALGAPPRATLAAALATLVAEKQLARHGEGRGSRYFPAGTTAKEAL